MTSRTRGLFAVFAACLLSCSPLVAATRTWTGAVDNRWSVAGNWSGGVAPVAGDDLTFPSAGAANKSTLNDYPSGTSFPSIQIGNGYVLSGNAINVSVRIQQSAAGDALTVSLGVRATPAPSTSTSIALGSANVFSGTLDVNGSPVLFFGDMQGSFTGNGTVVLEGPVITGSGTFSGTFIFGSSVVARFEASYPAATLSPDNGRTIRVRNATVGALRFGWGGFVIIEGVIHAGSMNCLGDPWPGSSRPSEITAVSSQVFQPGDIAGRIEATGTADLTCTNLSFDDETAPLNVPNVLIHAAGGLIGESPWTPPGAWRTLGTYLWYYPYTSTTVSASRRPWPGNFHNQNTTISDILWHNDADRNNALWNLNADGTYHGVVNLPSIPDPAWHPAGVNDFDGDGWSDILWHNDSTGNNAIWLMNGTTNVGIVNLPWLPTGYRVEATGDLDSDGHADIVVHNPTTGALALWLMNGTAFSSIANLPPITNPNERVVGVIPYRDPVNPDDGFFDLLLRDLSNGKQRVWTMRHLVKTGEASYPSVELAAYHVAAVGRYRDRLRVPHYPAFVVRNPSTGANAMVTDVGIDASNLPAIPIPTIDGYGPR